MTLFYTCYGFCYRYSMFEMETTDFEAEVELAEVDNKRLSYPQCVPGKVCE